MRFRGMVALLVALLPPFGAAGESAPARPAEPAETPARLVSLVPAATEVLFAIGVGDRVVGVSSYDRWPPEVEALPRVGALIDPNTELILSLDPDLVVVDPSQRGLSRLLDELGIIAFPWETGGVEDFYERLRRLGAAVDAGAATQELERSLRADLSAVAGAVPPGPRPRTLLVFGRRPGAFAELWVNGGVGFLHELIGLAGGDNVFGELQMQSFKAGLEVLVADPPEVVVESVPAERADRAAVTAEWRSLPGFDEVTVGLLVSSDVLVPGPRMAETARQIASILRRADRDR